jgi:LmbE family N-acetylglucosaminyl deacetylase
MLFVQGLESPITNHQITNPGIRLCMADLSPVLGRTLALVAHPDDETVGCGALLQRIREPVVVFCTDGAPREESFWGQWGSRLQYVRMRQEEATTALSLAGVTEKTFLPEQAGESERFVDQELHRAIPDALAAFVRSGPTLPSRAADSGR